MIHKPVISIIAKSFSYNSFNDYALRYKMSDTAISVMQYTAGLHLGGRGGGDSAPAPAPPRTAQALPPILVHKTRIVYLTYFP